MDRVGFDFERGVAVTAAAFFVLAIFLGGASRQGLWSDAFLQILALGLIAWLLSVRGLTALLLQDRLLVAVLTGVVLLPLLQLIELPPFVWQWLPGRALFAQTYDALGSHSPWLPISLDAGATFRAWLGVLPPLAVFFAALLLDQVRRRRMSLLMIGLGMVSVLIGLAQLVQGPTSPFRLFPGVGGSESVGFFVNRNHYASFLAGLIPFAAVWLQRSWSSDDRNRLLVTATFAIVLACLLLGIGMARSRAGLILAAVAVVLSFSFTSGRTTYGRRTLAVVFGIGVVLMIHFAFLRFLSRFEADPLEDARWTIAAVTLRAIADFFPIGSGFGTFDPIYRMFETVGELRTTFANRAHNDYLEIALEGGALGVLLMLAAIGWLGIRAVSAWRRKSETEDSFDRALQQAASITILLLLLHSTVDYPLRTAAIAVLFAWCAGLLCPVRSGQKRRSREAALRPHRPRSPQSGWRARRA